MAITLDEIVEEAAQLPEDVVAELIERIVVSHHGGIEPGIEAAWKAETSRRVAEITSGRVEGIPLEESLARASRLLRP
ncbi:MAG TPA: addiction module protein [Candidatus Methylacidiphilales bacterium]|jgi:putative addiction module component (TIGR02574 family)|nr:addiction module protein [Candidatus Methylacidiphilales bacterium]